MIQPDYASVVYFSSHFALCTTHDAYHASLFSRTGWISHSPQPVSATWIGSNTWRCLRSSTFTQLPPEEFDQQHWIQACEAAKSSHETMWKEMGKTYGYAGRQARKDMLWVYVVLRPLRKEVTLSASCLSKGGNGGGYPRSPRNRKKHLAIPANASDQTLGEAVLAMLAECTHAGKTPEQVADIWRASSGLVPRTSGDISVD